MLLKFISVKSILTINFICNILIKILIYILYIYFSYNNIFMDKYFSTKRIFSPYKKYIYFKKLSIYIITFYLFL